MKKLLKISGIVILVIIILMIILPFLFKDQIIGLVKSEANKNLNATLNFEDAGLNLFRSFPDLSLSLDELTIVNKAPFEGDTLLSLKEFNAVIDLWSIVKGDRIEIEGIKLIEPNFYVYVLEDSSANYNITQPDTIAVEDTSAAGDLIISLKEYSIENGNIAYLDQTSDMLVVIKNIYHRGKGDFSQENFLLETETEIEEFTFEKAGIKYLNNARTEAVINLDADMPAKKFTFKENEFQLNNLRLKFDGFIQMPEEEGLLMDINFASVNNDFKEIISLIPAVYSQNFEDLESSGKMSLKGFAKGELKDENLPGFNVAINIDNGSFQYPKLPTPVNNVNMNMEVNNPGGSSDNTVINMKQLHFELGNEPFDASLLVRNPQTTPYIETKAKGKIDLAKLKDALYLEGVTKLEGIINSDFEAKGTIAGVNAKSVENISAKGNISFSNIVYVTPDLRDEVRISRGNLVLTPKRFNLNDLNVQIGKSNLKAEGQLENMVSYVLSDGTIRGSLSLTSDYFDINPFMKEDEEESRQTADTAGIKAVSLPERINFTMNSNFKTVIYDNLTLKDVKGIITLSDGRLTLKNLSMNTLGGNLTADGYYHAPKGTTPDIAFNLTINNFSFKETYQNFVTVQQFAPMAQYIQGRFNSKLKLNSALDENMEPVWDSFNSSGSFKILNAAVKDFKPLEVVGEKLNLDALKNPSLNNAAADFTITNGRLHVSPFNFKILNYDVTLGGSSGLDQSLDYVMGVKIPASKLKEQGNKAISSLIGKDLQVITASTIEVKANIKGTIENPSVSTSAGDIAEETKQQITEQAKKEVNKQIEQKKEEITKQAEQKADTLKEKIIKDAGKKLKDLFR